MASHQQVAHRWAQDDANAREIRGFNMFYERGGSYGAYFAPGSDVNRIFSHGRHYVAAAFVTTKKGERVVLINADTYSMTTGRHLSYIRRAIPDRYRTFTVPHPDPAFKRGGSENFHADNIAYHVAQAVEFYAKGQRARIYKQWNFDRAEAHLREAADYAATFGVKWKRPASLADAAAKLEADAKARAKAERKAREEREQRERERMAALRVEQAPLFAEWLAGNGWRVPSAYNADENGNAYVRRYREGERDELQTSQGASVPWEHALKAFRFIKLCRERGEAFHTNGRTVRVGHYRVDSIDAQGNMRAGCHSFAWEHMAALAEREGVLNVEPSSEAVETREGAHA